MTSTRPIRVALVNDYDIVVAGLAAVLDRYTERVRVVELASGLGVASDVDVILYDTFSQPQGTALDPAGLMAGTSARVIVFSWNVDAVAVQHAMRAGAAGYLSKGMPADHLVAAIERVHSGEEVRPEPNDRFGRWPGDEQGLSARESEVLALICQGLTNQDITERAYIGMNTVKTHIRSLYRKIGVRSRAQAVRWGMEHGFTPDRSRVVRDS